METVELGDNLYVIFNFLYVYCLHHSKSYVGNSFLSFYSTTGTAFIFLRIIDTFTRSINLFFYIIAITFNCFSPSQYKCLHDKTGDLVHVDKINEAACKLSLFLKIKADR